MTNGFYIPEDHRVGMIQPGDSSGRLLTVYHCLKVIFLDEHQ